MKPKEDIEQFVANIDLETQDERDRHVLETLLRAHEDRQQRQSPTWRIIMKSNTAKLATAVMILLALGLSVVILDRMVTPAWALDQTINALKNIQAVHISGRRYDPQTGEEAEFELWARPQSGDPSHSGDCRLREGDSHLCIASEAENVTYVCQRYQNPKQEVVYITAGLNRGAYMFPSGDLLAEFKAMAEDWTEDIRKDPETGKSYAYITFSVPHVNKAQYWLIQVDVETKLPVRTGVWLNADRQGQPHYEFTAWEFNPDIPEGCFEFEVPADAQVVDCREIDKLFAENSDLGVSVGELDFAEACRKVATAYWQAVSTKDWDAVRATRPLVTGQTLAGLQEACADLGPIAEAKVSRMNHLGDPGTFVEVFCAIKTKDGTVRQSLLNVAIRETATGRMGVVAGVVGPELFEAN